MDLLAFDGDVQHVVGVGASAGGLNALERLLSHLPERCPAAFIVVQHLSPDHKSLMAEILGRHTKLRVVEAVEGAPLTASTVFLCPAQHNVEVSGACLRLCERAAPHALNLPVDQLLQSLAADVGPRAVAVILSGTGSDGRQGVLAVKSAGGRAFAQSPASARFDGMPLAAIGTGLVDAALSPEEIGDRLQQVLLGREAPPEAAREGDEDLLAEVLDVLQDESGFDFHEYKTATVMRRIERRQGLLGLARHSEYLHRLRVDPAEARLLAQDMLVSVTHFFRDPDTWSLLGARVLPGMLAPGHAPLRAWVAGCATGQEAYTLAMLLTEASEAVGRDPDFKLFATDVDREALGVASAGLYDADALAELTEARRERFFEPRGADLAVSRDLRKHIVFAEHNLVSDAPFIRMDVVTCRNVLIYMKPSLQQRVLGSLAFALRAGGVLVLGSSESLGSNEPHFLALAAAQKVFALRAARSLPLTARAGRPRSAGSESGAAPTQMDRVSQAAQRLLMERAATASALVDAAFEVVQVFGNRDNLLSLPPGAMTRQLLPLLPEGVRPLASAALRRARDLDGEVCMRTADGETGYEVRAERVVTPSPEESYFLLTLQRAAEPAPRGETVSPGDAALVQALEQELSTARASLHASIEELETSNEELQATNEELVASNEELQATNEELGSVNEELRSVNAEHETKIRELQALNDDLDHMFGATTVGMLFLDERLLVRRYSPPITSVVPLQPADLRRPLSDLATRLVEGSLAAWCAEVLESGVALEREVVTLDGSRFLLRVSPYFQRRAVSGVVASLLDTTPLRTALVTANRLQRVIDSLPLSAVIVDGAGLITQVNAAWLQFAAANGAGGRGWLGVDYLEASRANPEVALGLRRILDGAIETFSHPYPCDSPTQRRRFLLHAAPLRGEPGAVITHIDLSVAGATA